jgi:hypothetical protein
VVKEAGAYKGRRLRIIVVNQSVRDVWCERWAPLNEGQTVEMECRLSNHFTCISIRLLRGCYFDSIHLQNTCSPYSDSPPIA